jgi:hypothetical protein
VSLALIGALAACGGGSSSTASKTTTTTKGTTAGNVGTNGSTDTTAAVSNTVDTAFTGAGSAAICGYAKDLQAANITGDLTATTDLKATFTKLEGILTNIKDKAPAEIKADVDTMFGGYQKLIDLYKQYNYDTTKMLAAAAKDPNIAAQFASIDSAALTSAAARVTAYFTSVCGITTPTT